ncbi:MAG: prolipoprotein diacylglyceryl transferase [Deltaproteobacteria bacterium]
MISWQFIPFHIDPVIFSFGSFQLRYYGLMYLVAFAITYALVRYRLRTEPRFNIPILTIEDAFVWIIFGLIIGARIGDVIFYNLDYYFYRPWEIVLPFRFDNGFRFTGISGMSYHGGMIGAIVAGVIFCRKQKIDFWKFSDLLCPVIPLGYTFGRIGNFINGELFGRITTMPWGMYFPLDPSNSLRHPSQLYEAFFEGIFLFALLWSIRTTKKFAGAMLCFYIMGYGVIRFVIEFSREPETGFIFANFTMGQVLCFLMFVCGGTLYAVLSRRNIKDTR